MTVPPVLPSLPPDDGWSLRTLGWAWKNYDQIKTRVKEVRDWIWGKPKAADAQAAHPPRGILIIGPGGAGKTTLARILSGDFDWLTDSPWEYGESFGVEQYTLEDDPKVSVVVPPGQQPRRAATWSDHEKALAEGKYRGVVLVNPFGYETIPFGVYKDHPLYKGDKEAFLTSLLKQNRDGETAILHRLAPFLRTAPGKLWLLTVVTKQDLWYSQRKDAKRHYTTGEFAQIIESVRSAKGDAAFRHESIPISLVISNFVTPVGENLRKNTEGYDHRQQVESVRRLYEMLNSLLDWEAKS